MMSDNSFNMVIAWTKCIALPPSIIHLLVSPDSNDLMCMGIHVHACSHEFTVYIINVAEFLFIYLCTLFMPHVMCCFVLVCNCAHEEILI